METHYLLTFSNNKSRLQLIVLRQLTAESLQASVVTILPTVMMKTLTLLYSSMKSVGAETSRIEKNSLSSISSGLKVLYIKIITMMRAKCRLHLTLIWQVQMS
jgi:hypothetical protein